MLKKSRRKRASDGIFCAVWGRTEADIESLSYGLPSPGKKMIAAGYIPQTVKNASLPYYVCRGDHWSPANLPPQRIFRDSCLVRQAGTGEQCSPLQEFSPVWARNIPARRTVLSPTACGQSAPRRGGQGARFCLLCVQADLFPLAPCQKPSYVVYYFSTSPQANPVQTGDAKL